MDTETVVYVLEALTAHGWSDDPCLLGSAADCNVFDSIDAAQAALKELRLLWPDSTLRIRERVTNTDATQCWDAELTDTFAGEANYSWVRRESFHVPAGADQRTIVRLGKAALGLTGDRCRTSVYGEGYELRPSGSATVAFLFPAY